MATGDLPESGPPPGFVRLFHGTDLACANDLLQSGVDEQKAAAWNGSGEFWACTDPARADWFALSHPNSPPAARFEFDLPEAVLQALLVRDPPVVNQHLPND